MRLIKILLLHVFLVLCTSLSAQVADDEGLFMTVDAQLTAGYAPWKSFSGFRKYYNTSNDTSLTRKLGSLSDQYGFSLGLDFFVAGHLYSFVDYSRSYGRASAQFDNGTKRVISSLTNNFCTGIGWLQRTEKGYWTITTGFDFSFGIIRSYLVFADGTRYIHTSGLSGEFHDIAIGAPLKFELTRNISPKFALRAGIQANFYFGAYESGFQNSFIAKNETSLVLGDETVLFDITNATLNIGLCYKIVSQ